MFGMFFATCIQITTNTHINVNIASVNNGNRLSFVFEN